MPKWMLITLGAIVVFFGAAGISMIVLPKSTLEPKATQDPNSTKLDLSGLTGESSKGEVNEVIINGQEIVVELAQTSAERAQGLSGRESLAEGTGMLFIFDKPGQYGFWMKDMKFPIDIIWINNDTIVDIWPHAPIPTSNDIPSYSPKAEASYVLEVAAGFVDMYNVNIGDRVNFDLDF